MADKAFAIDPRKPYWAFVGRGLARLNLGRLSEALEDFAQYDSLAGKNDPFRADVAKWVEQASRP